jgi:hypothetical protein
MKKIAVILTVLALTSCGRFGINEKTASDVVQGILEQKNGGMAGELYQAAHFNNLVALCGTTLDTQNVLQYTVGERSASFNYLWSITLHCTSGIPDSITWTSNFNGVYEGPFVKADLQGTRNWCMKEGLLPSEPFRVDGTSLSTGVYYGKTGAKRTYYSETEGSFNEILVDRETRKIISGSAVFHVKLWQTLGSEEHFIVNVVFTGAGIVELSINGENFSFELYL